MIRGKARIPGEQQCLRERVKKERNWEGMFQGVGGNQENVILCRSQGRRRISNVTERLSMIRIEMRDTMRLLWLVESEDSGRRRDLSKQGPHHAEPCIPKHGGRW